MAGTALVWDEVFLRHKTGGNHPERPARLAAVRQAIEKADLWSGCELVSPTPVDQEAVAWIHNEHYIKRLRNACAQGHSYIDTPDSAICTESDQIARLAAGAVVNVVDGVLSGRYQNGFCAVRPPGHHAEHDRSLGFCLYNNIAIAAEHAIRNHQLKKVAILDWDVHHGNGTHHTFERRNDVLFISIHGHPDYLYPGTGYEHETGIGEGEGFTVNIPVMPESDNHVYETAFKERILPEIDRFQPELILVSAGFDAHRLDPLAPIRLESESFRWMTECVRELAESCCNGRLISILEGGYHLDALGESVVHHLAAVADRAI
jgi:acetoin utilization deacetylase AcuC-like enzyme